jgi:hypothetical protein
MFKTYEYANNNGSFVAFLVMLIGIISTIVVFTLLTVAFIEWKIDYATIRALIAFSVLTQAPTVFVFFHKRMNKDA